MNTAPIPILDLKPGYLALKAEFAEAIERVLESGTFIMGPDVAAFESEAAAYLGTKFAIGVNSGTDALVIGLRALGLQEGDEVITSPFTFFATAEAISQVGATPVFVDIDPSTFNIDVALVRTAITNKTKAILPVHLYGRCADMGGLSAIAREHGLAIIEDCAQSFGAIHGGRRAGSIGDVGAFSFFPSKTLGAFGDGGLISTDNDDVAALARALRVHGSKRKYHNEYLGYNSRLDSLQAAILRVKLPHIDAANAGRRRVASRYSQAFSGVDGVVAPEVTDDQVFHQYTVRIARDRDGVRQRLSDAGVGTMVYYPVPLHRLPLYESNEQSFPCAEAAAGEVLSLPIWPEMSDALIDRIIASVAQSLHRESKA